MILYTRTHTLNSIQFMFINSKKLKYMAILSQWTKLIFFIFWICRLQIYFNFNFPVNFVFSKKKFLSVKKILYQYVVFLLYYFHINTFSFLVYFTMQQFIEPIMWMTRKQRRKIEEIILMCNNYRVEMTEWQKYFQRLRRI